MKRLLKWQIHRRTGIEVKMFSLTKANLKFCLFYYINFRSYEILILFRLGLDRINLPLFSTVVLPSICMFLSCRPFVVITTLSTGLVGVEVTSVSWLGQLTVGV